MRGLGAGLEEGGGMRRWVEGGHEYTCLGTCSMMMISTLTNNINKCPHETLSVMISYSCCTEGNV